MLTASDIARLLKDSGLRPSKSLGQHFVIDANTVRRIARLAEVGAGDHVVEIGAGLGSLTLALLEREAIVTAVEIDRRLVPILRSVVEPAGARVVEGDALRLDWSEVLAGTTAWGLVANLPYNVATPLVIRMLEEAPAIGRMLVMVQREVGERLAAKPGEEGYGAVSVKLNYWATARVVGTVPPSVFFPMPKVESALVRVHRLEAPAVDVPYGRLCAVVQAGFAQRRKMLRRSLAGVVAPDAFERAGIRPDERPEQLGVEAWARLAAQ